MDRWIDQHIFMRFPRICNSDTVMRRKGQVCYRLKVFAHELGNTIWP